MRRNSCCVKQKLRKGLWSPEEDEKLYNYIKRFGVGCWSSVPKLAGLQRCGKSCRLRWINYLRPDLKRGMFSHEEEHLIISLHEALGNRWAQIATQLPGRTDNEIKNFWNSSLKKKLMKQGIDPSTHKPVVESIREIKDSAEAGLLHVLQPQPKGLPNLESTAAMDQHQGFQFNYVSKQAFEPLFLPDFQSGVETDGFQVTFQHVVRPFDPIPGFNSMPNLTNFDHQSIIDATEYSDNSGSRMSNVASNLDIVQTTHTLENGGAPAFPWDIEEKMDSMFSFQFNAGIHNEERKVVIPWQEAHHDQNSGVNYGNYPTITSMAQELNGVNLDVFQQI